MRPRFPRPLAVLTILAALAAAACGKPSLAPSGDAASSDGPAFMPGLGPASDGGRAEVGMVSGDAACATSTVRAERLPLDLYLMLDASYSMLEDAAPGVEKWEAVKAALSAFMMDTRSAGLGLGLQYFPQVRPEIPEDCFADPTCGMRGPCLIARTCSPATKLRLCNGVADCAPGARCVPVGGCANTPDFCAEGLPPCPGGATNACLAIPGYCVGRDICDAEAYAAPSVPIADLPGAAPAIMTALGRKRPEGRSPTGPALAGAIMHAQARLKASPGRRVAVVLASDGLPVVCSPNTAAAVAGLAEAGASGTPPVPTFAVGVVGASERATSLRNLTAIATAGGTGRPYLINAGPNTTAELLDALNTIRTRALTCEYKLPAPSSGALDYLRVNVQYTSGTGAVVNLGNVPDRAACDPERGGWYYDVPPGSTGAPSTVVICPASCEPLAADENGRVDIVLGCRTVFID
jgi:hypothetical protein